MRKTLRRPNTRPNYRLGASGRRLTKLIRVASTAVIFSAVLFTLSACDPPSEATTEHHEEHHNKIVVTNPKVMDVVLTEQYVCQIHSQRHIEVRALAGGYLEAIPVKEGQFVKQGDLMFKIVPVLYQAKLDSEMAEAELMRIKLANTEQLYKKNVVAKPEVDMAKAELARAEARVNVTRAELNFASIKAPFDGIIDRLYMQQGSLVGEGDMLTTLSDNTVMWVYFNVPEARYLEYVADKQNDNETQQVELVLADGSKFPQEGKIAAVEANFNNETGNIPFRADFPNPNGVLRHGQTGNVLLNRTARNATVIPQRATFEVLDKRYVFVVGEDHVVHQREIDVQHEKDDIFLIKGDLAATDKIILEGVRQVRDGDEVEYDVLEPDKALAELKFHAE
jgi:membrane fusion protein (multidrug efflux system)